MTTRVVEICQTSFPFCSMSIQALIAHPTMTSSHLPVDVSIDSSNSFPAFAKLPLELRLFIWELATLTPRRVSLNTSICCDPYPAILKVNDESRALALKSYVDICPKKLSLRTTHPRQYRFINLGIDFAVVRLVELVGGHRDWRELEEPLGMWNNRKEVVQGVTRMVIEGNQFLYMSIVEAQSQLGLAGVRQKDCTRLCWSFRG
jgi:hypothetical protein